MDETREGSLEPIQNSISPNKRKETGGGSEDRSGVGVGVGDKRARASEVNGIEKNNETTKESRVEVDENVGDGHTQVGGGTPDMKKNGGSSSASGNLSFDTLAKVTNVIPNELIEKMQDELVEKVEKMQNELVEKVEEMQNELVEKVDKMQNELVEKMQNELVEKVEKMQIELVEKMHDELVEMMQNQLVENIMNLEKMKKTPQMIKTNWGSSSLSGNLSFDALTKPKTALQMRNERVEMRNEMAEKLTKIPPINNGSWSSSVSGNLYLDALAKPKNALSMRNDWAEKMVEMQNETMKKNWGSSSLGRNLSLYPLAKPRDALPMPNELLEKRQNEMVEKMKQNILMRNTGGSSFASGRLSFDALAKAKNAVRGDEEDA